VSEKARALQCIPRRANPTGLCEASGALRPKIGHRARRPRRRWPRSAWSPGGDHRATFRRAIDGSCPGADRVRGDGRRCQIDGPADPRHVRRPPTATDVVFGRWSQQPRLRAVTAARMFSATVGSWRRGRE
jgi:hypothetical protein